MEIDIAQFFNNVATIKANINDYIEGKTGPIQEIKILIKNLNNEIDKNKQEIEILSEKYNQIKDPYAKEDSIIAMTLGLQAALFAKMNRAPIEYTEEQIKNMEELTNKINELYKNIENLKKSRDDANSKLNQLEEDFKKYGKLYYYMSIFNVDEKSAEEIHKLVYTLEKMNENEQTRINNRIDEVFEDIKENLTEFKRDIKTDFKTFIRDTIKDEMEKIKNNEK